MESRLKMLDTIKNKMGYENSSSYFKKIALANEQEWLTKYYAAYFNLVLAIRENQDEETKNNIYDIGFNYLHKADVICLNNSEIYALKGYISFMHMAVSPHQRAMQIKPVSNELIAKDLTLNLENPRDTY